MLKTFMVQENVNSNTCVNLRQTWKQMYKLTIADPFLMNYHGIKWDIMGYNGIKWDKME